MAARDDKDNFSTLNITSFSGFTHGCVHTLVSSTRKKGILIIFDIAFGGVFFEMARRKVILTKFKLHKKYNNNLY